MTKEVVYKPDLKEVAEILNINKLNTRQRLISLGLREELKEPVRLCSGKYSNVFWDIEKLFAFHPNQRKMALSEFISQISSYVPGVLVGIPTGGWLLAREIGNILGIASYNISYDVFPDISRRVILIDDVLTTGQTIKNWLRLERPGEKRKVMAVAVLINRSDLTEINGIPLISGVITDKVG